MGRIEVIEGIVKQNDLPAGAVTFCLMPVVPTLKSFRREFRHWPAAVDSDKSVHQPTVKSRSSKPIRYRGKLRADPVEALNTAEQAIAQRQPISSVIVIQELVFEFGHIDIGRALGLTGLALQAEIHHIVESVTGEFFFG